MTKIVHIVCLQVPYPPDYGGVVDLFWKLKYLHELGVTIHLHCFEYDRAEQAELLKYCKTVHYYKRVRGIVSARWNIPYIVSSRISKKLEVTLAKDTHPVLLEGIHCTWLLHKGVLKNRKVIIRLHNIEWDYYRQLAASESSVLKKWYFLLESRILKRYEPAVILKSDICIPVSQKDAKHWQQQGISNIQYLPVFTAWNNVASKEGKGNYCLYHGNLGIAENEKAALWLIEKVFSALTSQRLVIAGKNPSARLTKEVEKHEHIAIIPNPSEQEMQQLISDAHIHLLPSFTHSGIKLKLLNALFCGRFCIVNADMIKGTRLETVCIVADSANGFIQAIQQCLKENFSAALVRARERLLLEDFNNTTSAGKLDKILFEAT